MIADALVRWLKNHGVQLFVGAADEGLVKASRDARLNHGRDNFRASRADCDPEDGSAVVVAERCSN